MSIRRAHLPTGAAAGIGAWLLWYGKYSIDRVRTASARLADPAGHVARLDAIIRSGTEATLTDHAAAADFKPRLVQHLRWSLGGLEEHRQVEDFHYFPVFRRAEPGSRRGSSCSSAITARCIPQTPASWSARDAVLMAEITDSARFRAALARFHDAHLELGRDLLRHLDDEEDPGDPAAAGARRACLRRWRLNDLVAAQVAHDVVVDRAPRPYRARALPSVRVLV